MILRSIQLHNFGIYGGDNTFDLMPQEDERYHRPIVLFRGKNGVGKSTLVEAIRLCLHGRLAVGNRVKQREYEAHLRRRLHRLVTGETTRHAFIQLEFDYFALGRCQRYRVSRAWESRGQSLWSAIHIWVDGVPLNEDDEAKEYLLRELMPLGVAELFFFDGEKIATLAEAGEAGNALLADTVKNLLGLHLVEQLERDLDIYLTRQTGIREVKQYQDELEQLRQDESDYQRKREDIQECLTACRLRLQRKQQEIDLLEDKIASEGSHYAEKKTSYEEERQQLMALMGQAEQEIQELSRYVLPFSVAPRLLTAVRHRLLREAEYEQWQAAQHILSHIKQEIIQVADTEAYWDGVAALPDQAGREKHIQNISQLWHAYEQAPMSETDMIHCVSAEERGVLLNWIDEALQTVPQHLAAILQKREASQKQLTTLDEELERIPMAQVLQPLHQQRLQLERDMGRLEGEQARLENEDNRLIYHLERLAGSKRRVSQQIADIETDEERIKLAARTKLLLDEYQQQLTQRKLEQLAIQLVKRFNQLSRKRNFIDQVIIDPQTFQMTLYQAGKPFPRTQLSAGEDQIFAVATLWALREVSARPLPVIIDTPLSRLDDEHRHTMLAEFMPQVAQQVIVLATTTEIDEETFAFLQPAVSKAYLLSEQTNGLTMAEAVTQPIARQAPLIGLEEVTINATR